MRVPCQSCSEYESLSRRGFLQVGGATALAAGLPAWLPRVALADENDPAGATRQVIVSVFLRGGADGLTLCVPHGDPLYYATSGPTARPALAIPRPGAANGCTNLDGFFGLPPAMAGLIEPYNNGHLAVVHATGLNDPTRSHFDAMRFMETAVASVGSTVFTGWLGRHLASVSPDNGNVVLRGAGMGSYSASTTMNGGPQSTPIPDPRYYGLNGPWDTKVARLNALGTMYNAAPPALANPARVTRDTINLLASINFEGYAPVANAVYPDTDFGRAMKFTACLLKQRVGVEAITIDRGDWDTHSDQGPINGHMASIMSDLSGGLLAFYRDVFGSVNNVIVVVMSEFGRRPEQNGSVGCDHGHGNAMFLMGHSVVGRQVYARRLNGTRGWPGLGSLFENLDLHITTDYRDVLGEVVQKALNNPNLAPIFPNYTPVMPGLIR
jgi:uncharacterized protein (DUF1501 family)